MSKLYEKLAGIEHERWSDWQKHLHSLCTRNPDGSLTIPAELVKRWERQIATPYDELTEQEKDSDREQVDRYWNLVRPSVAGHVIAQPQFAIESPAPPQVVYAPCRCGGRGGMAMYA